MESPRSVLQNVGRRIIEIRTLRGWTQEACAEALGLDVRQLRRIEAGEHNVTISTLVRLARGLGVTTGALFQPPVLHEQRRPGRPRRALAQEALRRSPAPKAARPEAAALPAGAAYASPDRAAATLGEKRPRSKGRSPK